MPDLSDLLQTFARGWNRPEVEDENAFAVADDNHNIKYVRHFGTTTQRPAGAPPGFVYWDTTEDRAVVRTESGWARLVVPLPTNIVTSNEDLIEVQGVQRWAWPSSGSTSPSFTATATDAADGDLTTIYFPPGSISSITFDSKIDPSNTLAYVLDNPAAAYELVVAYRAPGYLVSTFTKVAAV